MMSLPVPVLKNPCDTGRRKFLFGALSFAALVAVDPRAMAQAWDDANDSAPLKDFMAVSRLVSPDASNQVTGAALYRALKRSEQGFDANLQQLAGQVATQPDVTIESLAGMLDNSKQTALRSTLNKIISAWYLGVVGYRTYAYEGAWMYRATADVLSPPGYVRRGPLYWAKSIHLPSH